MDILWLPIPSCYIYYFLVCPVCQFSPEETDTQLTMRKSPKDI